MSRKKHKKPIPRKAPAPEPTPRRKWRMWVNIGAGVAAVGALIAVAMFSVDRPGSVVRPGSSVADTVPALQTPVIPVSEESRKGERITELHQLLALPPEDLDSVDIARMNLLCAQGLPGAEGLDIEKELAVLDAWTEAVRIDTERNMHQFYENPGNFENSEGYFRILSLITVLQQDFGVRYNPDRIYQPDFTDSRDVFLHGLTQASSDESHAGGTCVSMPVVYVAVAKRLGYPVKLVTTKEHVFARWEDEGERFNIEATSQGLNVYDDDHYKTWPTSLTQAELDSGAYLRSMTPAEELGLFMAARGYVLEDTGRGREATVAYAYAHLLDPKSIDSFDNLGRSVLRRLVDYPAVQRRPGLPRMGGNRPPATQNRGNDRLDDLLPPRNPRDPGGIP